MKPQRKQINGVWYWEQKVFLDSNEIGIARVDDAIVKLRPNAIINEVESVKNHYRDVIKKCLSNTITS